MKNLPYQNFLKKLEGEYISFTAGLQNLETDEVIAKATEIAVKDNIRFYFLNNLSEERLKEIIPALINLEKPLDTIYRRWLKRDESFMEGISLVISETYCDMKKD